MKEDYFYPSNEESETVHILAMSASDIVSFLLKHGIRKTVSLLSLTRDELETLVIEMKRVELRKIISLTPFCVYFTAWQYGGWAE